MVVANGESKLGVCNVSELNEQFSNILAIPNSTTGRNTDDDVLLSPLNQNVKQEHQKWLQKGFLAFNSWFNIREDLFKDIYESASLLHNVQLMCDNMYKTLDSETNPVACNDFSSKINTGSYGNLICFEKCLLLDKKDGKYSIMKNAAIFLRAILDMYRGLGMERYWLENSRCPTEEEYKKVAYQKTGSYLAFIVSLMQEVSDNKQNFDKLLELLSAYYEINKDLYDIKIQRNYEVISEGRFTFPLIVAIHESTQGKEIFDILHRKTSDDTILQYCFDLIEKSKCFEYTENVLKELELDIEETLNCFESNHHFDEILDMLKSRMYLSREVLLTVMK